MRTKTFGALCCGLILAMLCAGPVRAGEMPNASPTAEVPAISIASASWLHGNWALDDHGVTTDEHWTGIAGGTMFGTSRTIAGGKTVFFEFFRIEERADGVFYVAQPKGRCPGVDFKLVRVSNVELVFENLKHDFPKRIIYRKGADGSLTARIEGDGTEKEKPQDYRYMPAIQ